MAPERTVIVDGRLHRVELTQREDSATIRIDAGNEEEVRVRPVGLPSEGIYLLIRNHRPSLVVVRPGDGGQDVTIHGRVHEVVADARQVRRAAQAAAKAQQGGPHTVRTTIAGMVIDVLRRVGDEVQAGEPVLVIEAMKMQNEVRAPAAGRITKLDVGRGDRVERGASLFVLDVAGER
jgi:pyruvate carboxylase subunit B